MADPVSLVGVTIDLIRGCVNKYTEFCAFKEECKTFRRSLSHVVDVLEDVKDELSRRKDSAENTTLKRPLSLLKTAVKDGGQVLKKCSAAKKKRKVLAFVFSRHYMGMLNTARADIKEAMRLLQFSSVAIQESTRRMMDSVSERLEELDRKILAITAGHNEAADSILRAIQLRNDSDRGDGAHTLVRDALVDMGVVSDAKGGADLLAELQKEAESIRKAKVVYDREILEAVLALTAPRRGAGAGPGVDPEMGLAHQRLGGSEATAAAVLECMICPISGEIMHDPVTVVETGITYDRESLCTSLLLYPDLEPATNQRYDRPLHYTPSFAVRSMITAQYGDSHYQRYNDDDFKARYDALWKGRLDAGLEDANSGIVDGNGFGGGGSFGAFSGFSDGRTGGGRQSGDLPLEGFFNTFSGTSSAGSCGSVARSQPPDAELSLVKVDEASDMPDAATTPLEGDTRYRSRVLLAVMTVVAVVIMVVGVLIAKQSTPATNG